MEIISGTALAKQIRQDLAIEVSQLTRQYGRSPKLAIFLVGEHPASMTYVNSKVKAAAEVGINCDHFHLPEATSQEELLAHIRRLNADKETDGILVQLPLPAHIDTDTTLLSIDPQKDVDGLHIVNVGKLASGRKAIQACTPRGVISLLKSANITIAGKHAVVAGRSNLVGSPMALLLLRENATVTVCHSKTENIAAHVAQADILVTAMGKTGVITPDMLKPGVVLIDVAMNYDDNGKLRGDVYCQADLPKLEERVAAASPVPGGVGPMTIASLLQNTVEIYKDNIRESNIH
ncbi:MAG: bifunctional 5,10-methylenetetrahydrofolate dehydrogenase/5,10-methenyltetrahydrofolate cyclohydrolase [Bacteroidales bacterium]|nr:bifunctional 5,10-methylenetetrahydrofolate dehydrogenase/5,10-methenyltetrahydrofolate cyclohydrolase [Bacteroidales bacterium]